MVPSVHYCPELVDVAIRHFNPSTSTIEGHTLSVNINPTTFWYMLCILVLVQRGMEVETFNPKQGDKIWSTKDKALEFYNEETRRIEAECWKPPKIPVLCGTFKEDLQDAFSMI